MDYPPTKDHSHLFYDPECGGCIRKEEYLKSRVMEIRIPYEVVREAVDKAGNPKEPGTAIVFDIWTLDGKDFKVAIERPKEWTKQPSRSHLKRRRANPHP